MSFQLFFRGKSERLVLYFGSGRLEEAVTTNLGVLTEPLLLLCPVLLVRPSL